MWANIKTTTKPNSQTGFTIVELLIVIVVIGILAAITIVAYNGIQNRAKTSSASSALSQAAKKIAVWQIDNPGITPSDLTTVGVADSGGVSYQYKPGTSGAYCITATSGNVSYKITEASQPESGACSGHGSGGVAAVTNLAINPSFEASSGTVNGQPGLSGIAGHPTNGSFAYQTATWAQSGSNSLQITASTNGSVDTFGQLPNGWFTPALQPNAKVSVAAYLRLTQAGSATQDGRSRRVFLYLNTTAGNAILQTTAAPNTVGTHLVRGVFTVPSDYTSLSFARLYNGHSDISVQWDGLTIVAGDHPSLTPQDGSAPNWVWNGTAHNSTSTGPPA